MSDQVSKTSRRGESRLEVGVTDLIGEMASVRGHVNGQDVDEVAPGMTALIRVIGSITHLR